MKLFLFTVNSDLNLEDFLQKFLLEKRVWLNVDVLENGDIFVSHDGSTGVKKSGWLALDGIAFYSKH